MVLRETSDIIPSLFVEKLIYSPIKTAFMPWSSPKNRQWKDADPDIPILKQAQAEYAKLQ